ncbi:receptor-like protein EIX2 [Andrographis paniculata]|uniref:receptor-like protein EIX2 n=1 Tax=Andrographis paniculata TaxID=175694 RepID=UPI0021E8E826|nr:receptor-like protein EIX2 [Andrographis paniculata]
MNLPNSKMLTALELLSASFFYLFFFSKLNYCSCVGDVMIVCQEIEKQALLDLKQSQENPSNLLSSWADEVNCCNWKGVVCNNFTGHVLELHLRGYNLNAKINSSLLNLNHLRFLDLSGNNLSGKFPSFIGLFMHLSYLNLSNAGFHGTIPHTVGNLSNLHTLGLESSYLTADSLDWLLGLHQLQHLNMNGVNLSNARNWAQVINRLPSLIELHLQSCNLNFFAPVDVVNVTSLTILDLSKNEFHSVVPQWIFQLSNLIYLDLSHSNFEGPIPSESNTTNLRHSDLSFNYFYSTIPDWLYSCQYLRTIDFSGNSLDGTLSNNIGNLSTVSTLDFFQNLLSGKIPDSLGNITNLKHLTLEKNQLTGAIPTTLQKLSSLNYFGLSRNKLVGNIPEWLGQLSKLDAISIEDNMFVGVVNENHLGNLTNLESLFASRNHLSLKVKPDWVPPFQLSILGLGSWNLGSGSQIPSWLETQKNILVLDLSDTGLSGTVPNWMWEIRILNLSHNNFHGHIPDVNVFEDDYRYLSLSSNRFSGPMPRIPDASTLDLSDNLLMGGITRFLCDPTNATYNIIMLFLGGNKLSGELPDCWMKFPELQFLDLGDNNFSGRIPSSIGGLSSLLSLNLYGNKFSGQIPDSLMSCTYVRKIDLSCNDLDGNIPTWMGTSLPYLKFLILSSNRLSGKIPSNICYLKGLHILDLSNNQFSGTIPQCVDNFTAMVNTTVSEKKAGDEEGFISAVFWVMMESVFFTAKGRRMQYDTILSMVTGIDLSNNNLSGEIPNELASLKELRLLNLSGNHLMGSIPKNIGYMKELESLDLSRNSLHGEMPSSFSIMSSLSSLNLSYNNLTGMIPESTQIRGFDPSSFVGNSLCGPPLTNNCSSYDPTQFSKPRDEDDHEDNDSEVLWLYVFISLGYTVGLSTACTVLILKKPWRIVFFRLVEDMWDVVFVYFYIKWRRLRSL